MLDIHAIRRDSENVKKALNRRGAGADLDRILDLDKEYRQALIELESLYGLQNKANEEIARLKKSKGDAQAKIGEMKEISRNAGELKGRTQRLEAEVQERLLLLPNLPAEDVPDGPDAGSNRKVRDSGKIPKASFEMKSHADLGRDLGILDLPAAAKVSGASFVLFKGDGARLERAMIQWMLDLHGREHGYTEVSPPSLVKRACMQGTGQLPKFEEDMYRIYRGSAEAEDGAPREDDLFLVPTAEVPVTNIHREEILDEEQLPVSYVAYTPCFRLEAGAYGKETKGMVRVHQFDKVELVKMTKPEGSAAAHEELTAHAEKVFQLLEIPYRVMLLATGDMGFAAAKCYDIEIWAPGLGQWLEASSCSNFLDFQARRAGIKYRPKDSKKPRFVHTLNGSGVALARTFVALLENRQQADGSVLIPEVLRPYMGGQTHIKRKDS